MAAVYVYVLDKNGKPLDPTTRCGHVRILLKQKKARVVNTKPFTIRLTYDVQNPDVTKRYVLGIDPGRENIGMTVVTEDGKPVYSAHLTTDNKSIPKRMAKRKACRQASRKGERKRRQRRARACHTDFPDEVRERVLPGCKEPIHNHYIINTEAKFNNRKRSEGWLTPTATHLLRCHVNAVKKVMAILPVSDIVLEENKFAFMQMDNPNIKPWEYQKGPLRGFKDVDEAVYALQEGHCIFCEKGIEHYHHIVPRHKGGSDTLPNKVGVCKEHHALIHTSKEWLEKLKDVKDGINKKYGALSVVNQIMLSLLTELNKLFPSSVYVTTGKSTKAFRDRFAVSKDHHMDAYCIACSILDVKIAYPPERHFELRKFRRHDRAIIKYQRERTYKYEGKVVARNRKPRFEQDGLSLVDFLNTFPEDQRRKICSKLTVVPSKRGYNNLERLMPGAVIQFEGEKYIFSSQKDKGTQYKGIGMDKYVPSEKCKVVCKNAGLVYV